MSIDLKLAPKLGQEHVRLTPFSVMNVKLATQILSESVSKLLQEYYPAGTHGTADLCLFMDRFFYYLNVRKQSEGLKKRKPFLQPYTNVDDPRFDWLENL